MCRAENYNRDHDFPGHHRSSADILSSHFRNRPFRIDNRRDADVHQSYPDFACVQMTAQGSRGVSRTTTRALCRSASQPNELPV